MTNKNTKHPIIRRIAFGLVVFAAFVMGTIIYHIIKN